MIARLCAIHHGRISYPAAKTDEPAPGAPGAPATPADPPGAESATA
jgi:hypothetical protein